MKINITSSMLLLLCTLLVMVACVNPTESTEENGMGTSGENGMGTTLEKPDGLSATTQNATTTLEWNKVTGAVTYEVQIEDSEEKLLSTTSFYTTKVENYKPEIDQTKTQIHNWRVRAVDSDGQKGPWSSVSIF